MNKEFIYKSLTFLFQYFIYKAKVLPPGTRRQRKDGLYEKQSDGTWKKVIEEKSNKKIDYAEKVKKWNNISEKWEGQENIGFRAVNNLEDITKSSIDIFEKEDIIQAGNAYGFTYDEDYNEIPYEEVKEKVFEKIQETYQENNLDVKYEKIKDGFKFTYPGVNTTERFDSELQGSYKYFVVLEGDTEGYNYYDDTPVKSITDIKAVYDSNGNEVKIDKGKLL